MGNHLKIQSYGTLSHNYEIHVHLILENSTSVYIWSIVKTYRISLASYKSRYSNDKSFDFIIPLMVLLFLGVVYMLSLRSSQGYVNFILIGVAAVFMIYWVRVLKKMTVESSTPQYTPKEADTKNWVYDLIKGEKEIIFVAEVPGHRGPGLCGGGQGAASGPDIERGGGAGDLAKPDAASC